MFLDGETPLADMLGIEIAALDLELWISLDLSGSADLMPLRYPQ